MTMLAFDKEVERAQTPEPINISGGKQSVYINAKLLLVRSITTKVRIVRRNMAPRRCYEESSQLELEREA
jgi:hypothetical protein